MNNLRTFLGKGPVTRESDSQISRSSLISSISHVL